MRCSARLAISLATGLFAVLELGSCSNDGWTRNMGVVGTGNAGRVRVTAHPGEQDPARSGTVYLMIQTDSIPSQVDSCSMTLDSACHFSPAGSGTYRVELWIAGRLTGRSGWFSLSQTDLSFSLDLSPPQALRFRFSKTGGSQADTVLLGSRRQWARFLDSAWSTEGLPDSNELLWVHFSAGPFAGWNRVPVVFQRGTPSCGTSLGCQAILPMVLDWSDANWADATIIGIPGFTGSSKDNLVYGSDSVAGLGGAWDSTTVGRTLWKVAFPASISGRTVRSARLTWTPAQWGLRPVGGRDYVVQGFRMRRSWNESSAGYGTVNSASVDGATALDASWNNPWTGPLVALDGSDADSEVFVQDTLPYLSLSSMPVDVRGLVQGWLSNPSSNFGAVFRDLNEGSGNYLDYPDFWMKEAREPLVRPRLVLDLVP